MEECLHFRVYLLNYGTFSGAKFLTLKLWFAGRCWLKSGRAVDYVNTEEKAVDLAPLKI